MQNRIEYSNEAFRTPVKHEQFRFDTTCKLLYFPSILRNDCTDIGNIVFGLVLVFL